MALTVGDLVAKLRLDDSEFDTGVDGAESKMGGLGKKLGPMAAAAGVAVAAAFTERFVEAMNVEAANDRLAGQLGLTAQESERAGTVAGSLFKQAYGDNIEEVNETLAGIQRNIGDLGDFTDQELEGMGASALNLADILDADVGETTRGVGQLMRSGLAKDAEHAFDIITAGAQQSKGRQDELLETIEEYSGDFAALGLEGPQAIAMLNDAVENGARNMDIAADAVREFTNRATDGSAASAEGFERLGFNAEDMTRKIAEGGEPAQQAMSDIIERLGEVDATTREQAGVALFGTRFEEMGLKAVEALDPINTSLENVGGSADRLDETLNDNLRTRVTETWRTISHGAVEQLGRVIEFIDETIVPRLQAFGEAVGPIVERIVGWFRTFGEQSSGQVSWVSETVAQLQGIFQSVFDAITAIVSTFVSIVTEFWDRFGEHIIQFAETTWNNVKQVIGGVLDVIQGIFEVFAGLFTGDWSRLWEGVKQIVSGVWNAIQGIVRQAINVVSKIIGATMAAISQLWSEIWERVKGTLVSAWDAIKSTARSGVDAVHTFFVELPGRILSAIASLPGKLLEVGRKMLGRAVGLLGGLVQVWADVTAWFLGLPAKVVGFFSNAGEWLIGAGKRIIGGLVEGLESMVTAPFRVLDRIGQGIADRLPGSPVKEGPLKVLNRGYAGGQIVKMLADGMGAETSALARQAETVARAALPNLGTPGAPQSAVGGDGASAGRGAMLVELSAGQMEMLARRVAREGARERQLRQRTR